MNVSVYVCVITAAVVVLLILTAEINAQPEDCDAPIINAKENAIKNQYIVVMKESCSDEDGDRARKSMEESGGKVYHSWKIGGNKSEEQMRGFAVSVDDKKRGPMLRKAKKDCNVKYIEQDQWAKAVACNTQQNSGWCLSRIRNNNNNQYPYPSNGGAGAAVYVIDSGCNPNHPDLQGRVKETRNFHRTENNQDNNGHGTATASLVGGRLSGTAKSADLYCLKALGSDGQGAYSDIIAAVNWAAARSDKGIISMSLGGGYSSAVNDAVDKAYRNGHLVVAAAGNDNRDAGNVSPASTPSALTIAASDSSNRMASYSNYGRVIDFSAPGSQCNAADLRSNGYSSWTGTSMSTPLVAGICALIQVENRWLGASDAPQRITNAIIGMTRNNVLSNMKPNTVNKLVYYGSCN